MRQTSILTLCILILASCSSKDEDVVAKVYGHKLKRSEVAAIVPSGASTEDSMAITSQYIEQWIDQMVIISKAEKNVRQDFSKQMEHYRNSLLVHAYEQQILAQNIDTTVSDNEIAEYYDSHHDDFLLASPIVKMVYVKIRKETPQKIRQRITSLMTTSNISDESIVKIQQAASPYSIEISMSYDQWMPLGDLRNKIPDIAFSNPSYLRYHNFMQQEDSTGVSLINLIDYKITNERAPLEVERDNIKAIIINHRRVEFIKRMRQDIRQEAEQKGQIERY